MAGHGRLDPAAAAECSVIGCLMMDAGKCGGVFEVATAEMFEGVDTRKLFEACVLEHEAGRPIDPVTVADKAGGDSRNVAAMCAEIAPHISRAVEYAEIVRENWRKRTIASTLAEIAADAFTPGVLTKNLLEQMEVLREQQNALETAITEESAKPFIKRLVEWMASLQKPKNSVKGGFYLFDRILGGFERGGLYVISARPGAGKTDFSLQLAAKMAKTKRVYYCTMEMPADQCVERIVSNATRINSAKMRDRTLSVLDMDDITRATEAICKAPLTIDDAPAISAADIKAKIIKHRPDVIFVDNLQLMAYLKQRRNQHEMYAETTAMLKQIALKYKVVVILLAQESREADKGGRPTLSGLRGSAAIESDSDGVIFIRNKRPDHFLEGDESIETTVYIEKNRHGGTGVCHFLWQPQYHRYLELEPER